MDEKTRGTFIWLMNKSVETLGNITKTITQEEATTWRDSGNGWTVVEVLCHLRDFDGFFRHRAEMMLAEDHPQLPAYDHEALAIEQRYNDQDLYTVYAELIDSRGKTSQFFESLTEDQWKRTGIHPERGHFTMIDALIQVGTHETNHIEQITRIIAERETDRAEN